MADGSRYVYPSGKAPEQLFLTLRTLIDTLNRQKQSESTDLTEILAALEVSEQQISELWDAVNAGAAGITPQQIFEISLVTAVDTMLGSVSNLVKDTIRRSNEAADSVIRSLLAGKRNQTAIRVEQQARLTDREAFASQIETISAQLGNALAAITTETTARTNADNALASVDQQITTALNGNIAQVQILVASVDGIESRFGVALNANGHVVGLIQLDGAPSGSAFTVVADKLLVAYPGINGGDPIPVLTLEDVDGETVMALNGTLMANAINAGRVQVARLDAVSSNFGDMTCSGIQRSANGKMVIDWSNNRRWTDA